jgi:eukaryotic-like serine/threonine-protein kinase
MEAAKLASLEIRAPGAPEQTPPSTAPDDSVADSSDPLIAWVCKQRQLEASIHNPPSLSAGEVIARRYFIEGLLARGGMGEVYVAFDMMLEQHIALKAIVATMSDDPTAIRRLCREARLARRVQHPNVCRVYDIGIHGDEPREVVYFMTMELIEGPSLRRLARLQPTNIARAVEIAGQVLDGLQAIHAAGVLHGDLKSENVMFDVGGSARAVIVDFGLARSLGANREAPGGPICGSIGYMSAEQLEGRPLSPRADIFSFGVVLFELLTGHLPFDRSRCEFSSAESVPPGRVVSAIRPEVPAALCAVLERCLSPEPAYRYPSAADVIAALRALDPGHATKHDQP